jgi:hypothetical protein
LKQWWHGDTQSSWRNQGRRRLLPKHSQTLQRSPTLGRNLVRRRRSTCRNARHLACPCDVPNLVLKKMVNSSGTDAGCSHGAPCSQRLISQNHRQSFNSKE